MTIRKLLFKYFVKIFSAWNLTIFFFTYCLLLLAIFFFQRNLQYIPSGTISGIPESFEEKILTTEDNVKILSWFREPKENKKIILYFHGNAGNLGGRQDRLEAFINSGFGVLAISYRGYPGSEGEPTEAGLINDGKAALKFILDIGYLPKDVVLYGESLGSGVAVQLAAKFDVAAVILESPYSSITSVAQKIYWFAPVSWILKDTFDSAKFASEISSPTLIIHGTADNIVPFTEGKKLFDLIKAPKKFIEVQGAGHLGFSAEFLADEVEKFVGK